MRWLGSLGLVLLFSRSRGYLMVGLGVMLRILTLLMMLAESFLWPSAGSKRCSVRSIRGVVLALQALMPVYLGIDNKNVCNNMGKIIGGWSGTPFCFCADGDLLACVAGLLRYRSNASVKVSKVKAYVADAMVSGGRVRREDKEGNDAADVAADFGRLRQSEVVIDALRNLLRVKKEWYRKMLVLHRFMIAIAREALNHGEGDGSVTDQLIWGKSFKPKVRKTGARPIEDSACLPSPPGFWIVLGSWWTLVLLRMLALVPGPFLALSLLILQSFFYPSLATRAE